ncbi:MAG: hypothetical protein QOI06_2553 [Nocardioidaceae bacterium]|nr:hypothetical protein [Nocardioidaceae bacterium]
MRPNWYSTTRRIPRVHDDRHPYFCPTNASETASTGLQVGVRRLRKVQLRGRIWATETDLA